jgi:hypothetical protein
MNTMVDSQSRRQVTFLSVIYTDLSHNIYYGKSASTPP